MIVPKPHDRLLLGGTLIGTVGVVAARSMEGFYSSVGLVLVAAGIVAVLAGIVLKLGRGR